MTAFTSKFSENQYLSATLNRFPLMGQILAETMPKLTLAAASHAGFSAVLTELTAVVGGGDGVVLCGGDAAGDDVGV